MGTLSEISLISILVGCMVLQIGLAWQQKKLDLEELSVPPGWSWGPSQWRHVTPCRSGSIFYCYNDNSHDTQLLSHISPPFPFLLLAFHVSQCGFQYIFVTKPRIVVTINRYPIRNLPVVFQRRIQGGLLIILVKTQEKSIFSQSNLRRENNKGGFLIRGGVFL